MNHRITIFLYLLLTLSLLSSCAYDTKPIHVNVGDLVQLELPAYFKAEEALAKDAILQYGNKFRNIYCVGFKDEKVAYSDLSSYADHHRLLTEGAIRDCYTLDESVLTINGHKGLYYAFSGIVGNNTLFQRISYHQLNIETDKYYYHFTIWHWSDTDTKYKETIMQIFNSIKAL